MSWQTETFAYAYAKEDDTWFGVTSGTHVVPMRPGLIMRPDIVSDPSEVEGEAVDGGVPVEYRAIVDGGGEQPEPNREGSFGPLVSRFYARFDLDQVRGIRQLEEIMTNVTNHLGSNVKITVEIEAESPAGWGDLNSRPPAPKS